MKEVKICSLCGAENTIIPNEEGDLICQDNDGEWHVEYKQ